MPLTAPRGDLWVCCSDQQLAAQAVQCPLHLVIFCLRRAWEQGSLEDFGHLMFESCKSSIDLYECGSPAIHDLHEIVCATGGVIGSRFSGGGFGGCVVGLVKNSHAESAVEEIKKTYLKSHPETEENAAVYLANSVNGVRLL